MWIKKMADGKTVKEHRESGKTWMRTASQGIVEVFMFHDGSHFPDGKSKRSVSLTGYKEYWHSRGVILDPSTGEKKLTAERIQGLREDGQWDTIEFNGTKYLKYVAPKAYGKPT